MLSFSDLSLIAAKTGGKNEGGFYEDKNHNKYLLKVPNNIFDFFGELFGGRTIEAFKKKKFIDPLIQDALICADFIKLPNGKYGSIQPCVEFTVLYKLLNTGNLSESDRSVWFETLWGPQQYQKIKDINHYGLSGSLLWSLIMGAYSFHSGNIPVFEKTDKNSIHYSLFGRIDWGDAFRNYGNPKNLDILNPYEYQGWLNYKKYTKFYLKNYTAISGLFSRISRKANELLIKISFNDIYQIMLDVTNSIPTDMFDATERLAIAKYISIDSFKNATCGNTKGNEQFAKDMAKVMYQRMQNISILPPEDISKLSNQELDKSYTPDSPEQIQNLIDSLFAEEKENMDEILRKSKEETDSFESLGEEKPLKQEIPAAYELKELRREDLLKLDPNTLQNEGLKWYASIQFFDKGAGGLHQIKKDFIERTFQLMGKRYLGFSEEEANNIMTGSNKDANDKIHVQLVKLLGKEDAERFISAISQGPAAFIPFTIGFAVRGMSIQIKSPTSFSVNVNKIAEGNIDLTFSTEDFPIISFDTAQPVGHILGLVTATFKCKQSKETGEWGFELEKINTNNPDIIAALEGKILDEQYIIDKYCTLPVIKPNDIHTYDRPKHRKTPGEIAAGNIGRFLNDKGRYLFKGVTRSKKLLPDVTQTISSGIVFYTFEEYEKNNYVHAFYPTCDSDTSYVDTISLGHALVTYKRYADGLPKNDGKTHKLVIPLATSQLNRKHWLGLHIEIAANNKVTAKLTDSQKMGYFYPTTYIEEVVNSIFNTKLQTEYLYQQALYDKVSCGYFYLANSMRTLDPASTKRIRLIDDAIIEEQEKIEKMFLAKSDDDINQQIPTNSSHVLYNSFPIKDTLTGSVLNRSTFEIMNPQPLLESSFIMIDDIPTGDVPLNVSNDHVYHNLSDDLWSSRGSISPQDSSKFTNDGKMEELATPKQTPQEAVIAKLMDELTKTESLKEIERLQKQREENLRKKEEEEKQRLAKQKNDELKKKREEEEKQRLLKQKEDELRKKKEEERKQHLAKEEETRKKEEEERRQQLAKEEETRKKEEEKLRKKQEEEKKQQLAKEEEQRVTQQKLEQSQRKKRKILGFSIGGTLGLMLGLVPALLIFIGIISLPFTWGGSSTLIGVGLILSGTLIGGGIGLGIGAWFGRKQSTPPPSSGNSSYANMNRTMGHDGTTLITSNAVSPNSNPTVTPGIEKGSDVKIEINQTPSSTKSKSKK